MKKIINCQTGEVTQRELTAEELAQQEIDAAAQASENQAKQTEAKAQATAKAELLKRLGITADEAKLLLA